MPRKARRIDRSGGDSPLFSVAVYADFTEATLDSDLMLSFDIATPINGIQLLRN